MYTCSTLHSRQAQSQSCYLTLILPLKLIGSYSWGQKTHSILMLSLLCHNRLKPFSFLIARRRRWHTASLQFLHPMNMNMMRRYHRPITPVRSSYSSSYSYQQQGNSNGESTITAHNYYGVFQHPRKQLLMTTLISRRVWTMATTRWRDYFDDYNYPKPF